MPIERIVYCGGVLGIRQNGRDLIIGMLGSDGVAAFAGNLGNADRRVHPPPLDRITL